MRRELRTLLDAESHPRVSTPPMKVDELNSNPTSGPSLNHLIEGVFDQLAQSNLSLAKTQRIQAEKESLDNYKLK